MNEDKLLTQHNLAFYFCQNVHKRYNFSILHFTCARSWLSIIHVSK